MRCEQQRNAFGRLAAFGTLADGERFSGLEYGLQLERLHRHALAKRIDPQLTWGQVHIRRINDGRFELRHVVDAEANADALGQVQTADLRSLTETNALGQFRPLKAAPHLRSGWRCVVNDLTGLETALRHLYPGSVADWHALELGQAQPTSYR